LFKLDIIQEPRPVNEPEPLGKKSGAGASWGKQQEPEPEPQKRCGSPAPQNTGKVRLVLR